MTTTTVRNNCYLVCAESITTNSGSDNVSIDGFQWGFSTAPDGGYEFYGGGADDVIKPNGRLWVTFLIRDNNWSFRESKTGLFPTTPVIYNGGAGVIEPLSNDSGYNFETVYDSNLAPSTRNIVFQLAVQKTGSSTPYVWDPQIENDGTGSGEAER